MTEVGIRALKQNSSAVVAAAAAGDEITITDHGRPVAQIIPLPSTRLASLIASGRARPAKRSIAKLPPPKPPRAGQHPLSATLAADRDDQRY